MSTVRRSLASAIGLNAIAFALIVAVQQGIIFPILSRLVSVDEFAATILLITISTVIVNVTAGEMSNVALIRHGLRTKANLPWDAPRLLVAGMLTVTVGAGLLFALQLLEPVTLLQIWVITVLGMMRTFGVAPEKASSRFGMVVIVHGVYAVGAVGGLLLVEPLQSSLIPFIAGESLALLSLMIVRVARSEPQLTLQRTPDYSDMRSQYWQLALVAVLMNTASYLDRLLIVPILGAAALSAYYAATALGKSLSMITNPAANALLARVGGIDDSRAASLFRRAFALALGGWVVLFGASLLLTIAGLYFLYPMYFDEAIVLVVPAAIAAASGSASDMIRPLIMRFVQTSRFLSYNLAYVTVFAVSVWCFSSLWGLSGFAWGTATARCMLFGLYLLQAKLSSRSRHN